MAKIPQIDNQKAKTELKAMLKHMRSLYDVKYEDITGFSIAPLGSGFLLEIKSPTSSPVIFITSESLDSLIFSGITKEWFQNKIKENVLDVYSQIEEITKTL